MLRIQNRDYGKNNPKISKIATIKGNKESEKKALFLDETDGAKGEKQIILSGKDYFQPVPHSKEHQIERNYISGMSGSGKSTYLANWISQYLKQPGNSDKTIYIISSVEYDPVIDDRFSNNIFRIPIDDDLVSDPLREDEFDEGVIVFDDTSKIKNIKQRNAIFNLLESMCEIARHYKLQLLITSHMISNYSRTRTILNESTSVTLFPKYAGGLNYIKDFLSKRCGLNKNQVKHFLNMAKQSRWVTIYKQPMYLISAKECYMIDQDED